MRLRDGPPLPLVSKSVKTQNSEESATVRTPKSRDRFFCFDWFASTISAIFLCIRQGSEGPQNNADWLFVEAAQWRLRVVIASMEETRPTAY